MSGCAKAIGAGEERGERADRRDTVIASGET